MGTTVQDAYLKNFGLDVNSHAPPPAAGQDQPPPDQQTSGQDQPPPNQQTDGQDQPPPNQQTDGQDQPPPDQQTSGQDQPPPDQQTNGQDQPPPDQQADGQDQPPPDQQTDGQDQPPPDQQTSGQDQPPPDQQADGQDQPPPDQQTDGQDQPPPDQQADGQDQPPPEQQADGQDQPPPEQQADGQDQPPPDQQADGQDQPRPDQQADGQDEPPPEQQADGQDQPPPDQQADGQDQPPPDQQADGQDQQTNEQDDEPADSGSPVSFNPLDPDALRKAAAKVAAQSAEADDWLRTYLRGNNLAPDRLGDGSGKTVMFGNKTTPLATVISTTLAAARLANLKLGGNDLMTTDRVQRIVAEILLAADPHVPGPKSGKSGGGADPRQVSMYLQYTFIPTTVHTPTAGGKDSKDQPGHSLAGQLTMEHHANNEAGLEISVVGQATWFADEKGGHLTNQSGFTGAQVAWVWTFLDGALQAGPQFQALAGASKAQNKLTDRLEWMPTGQVGAGGQVQYAVPGLGGHVLVGIQGGVSATDPKGGDSTVDKSVGLTFTYKF